MQNSTLEFCVGNLELNKTNPTWFCRDQRDFLLVFIQKNTRICIIYDLVCEIWGLEFRVHGIKGIKATFIELWNTNQISNSMYKSNC